MEDKRSRCVADRKNAITISSLNDSIRSIIGLMVDRNSTYTIVTDLGEVRGIITYKDIVALLAEKIEEDIPAFIIGLPEDAFVANQAKSKFIKLIRQLRKASPEIEEAKCHIKLRNIHGKRTRYDVYLNIITPYKMHTYRKIGWDLPSLFDGMSDSLKKKLAHRPSERHKKSSRRVMPGLK